MNRHDKIIIFKTSHLKRQSCVPKHVHVIRSSCTCRFTYMYMYVHVASARLLRPVMTGPWSVYAGTRTWYCAVFDDDALRNGFPCSVFHSPVYLSLTINFHGHVQTCTCDISESRPPPPSNATYSTTTCTRKMVRIRVLFMLMYAAHSCCPT